jgi:soluble lytic murein transglycosylase-like protein
LGQVSNAPLVGPGLTALAGLCLVILAVLSLQPLWHGPADSGQVETGIQARPVDESTTLLTSMLAKLRQAKAANSPKNIPAQPQQRSMTYEEMFQEIGPQYGLDWRLLAAQAYQESRLNPLALGKDNDMGLMQILPSTWYEWAPKMGVSDPYDPYSNVLVAAAYLAYLRQYCQARGYLGDQWMLAAYNWGPDNIRQVFENNGDWAQVPETTRRYTSRILQAVQP